VPKSGGLVRTAGAHYWWKRQSPPTDIMRSLRGAQPDDVCTHQTEKKGCTPAAALDCACGLYLNDVNAWIEARDNTEPSSREDF
jgi:hypothetical protein